MVRAYLKVFPDIDTDGDWYRHMHPEFPVSKIVSDFPSNCAVDTRTPGYFRLMVVDFTDQDEMDAVVANPKVISLGKTPFQAMVPLSEEEFNALLGEV